jgi:hypothetical protein
MATIQHRRRPTRRGVRLAGAVSGLGALVLSTLFAWQTAYARFTDASAPLSAAVTTAKLVLTDDDAGTALFSATGLKPGAAGTRCIVVTSASPVPTVVRLYAPRTSTPALASALVLTVDAGTGGTNAGGCTGFVPTTTLYSGTLAGFPVGFSGGLDNWTPAPATSETRTYQLTYRLPTSVSSGQDTSTTLAFTWEAQTR